MVSRRNTRRRKVHTNERACRGRKPLSSCPRRSRKSGLTRKIGPLKKGQLKHFGYKAKLPSAERHIALKRAVRKYGNLSVWKKINVLYVYSKYSNPTLHTIYGADRNWIRHTYGLKLK